MKLKEQFRKPFDCIKPETLNELSEIAENFAIGFAEWIKINFALHQKREKYCALISSVLWKANEPTILYSEKELLEIYKKTL